MAQEDKRDAITIVRGPWSGWVRFDDNGITFRNPGDWRTDTIGWDEVRWFRDGRSPDDNGWALAIELRNGRFVIVGATSSGKPAARPGTLRAIGRAAERYAIPTVLTGTPASSGPPAEPGLYCDPGGKLGLRQWSGAEWSPFLQVDRASSGPEGEKGPARVWSPLPETVQQKEWADAASRTRREKTFVTCALVATAGAVAIALALYVYDLSKPHPNFGAAETALTMAGFGLLFTLLSGSRYSRGRYALPGPAAPAGTAADDDDAGP